MQPQWPSVHILLNTQSYCLPDIPHPLVKYIQNGVSAFLVQFDLEIGPTWHIHDRDHVVLFIKNAHRMQGMGTR